jgi:hypothetical protein
MTNLTAVAGWDAIPQHELDWPLRGGPGGHLNKQAQALLNRTELFRAMYPTVPIGVAGDGVTDDYPVLSATIASGRPCYLPYTPNGYRISQPLNITCDFLSHGFFVPDVSIGSASHDYDRFAVVVAEAGYGVKRRVEGVRVKGSAALRAAGVHGVRVDCPGALIVASGGSQLGVGIGVRSYSVTLRDCIGQQCVKGVSAYARDSAHEINALTIDGGNFDSCTVRAFDIGDTSWSDAMTGTRHGVVINIVNGPNTDGAESHADYVGALRVVGTYSEGTNTDTLWVLGGSGDGNVADVEFSGNYWKDSKYAVKCASAVKGLRVRRNNLSNISVSEVSMSSDIYGLDYSPGDQVGCFSIGQPVRLAFRSLPITNITFSLLTLEHENLRAGIQDCLSTPAKWYPCGAVRNPGNRTINVSSGVTAFYTSPATNKAGVVSGGVFTFTTAADARAFNGGDRIVTAPAGATYVRSVDYDAGTMVIDGGVTAAGAATVSQQAVTTATAA